MIKKDKIYNTRCRKIHKENICVHRVKALIEKATIHEQIFKLKLIEAGIKFVFQKGFIEGDNFCIADFYLPKPYNLVIEIDGEYHNTPIQADRDKVKNTYYRNLGLRVKRIKNEDVSTFDIHTLIKSVDAKYKPKKKIEKTANISKYKMSKKDIANQKRRDKLFS